MRARDVFHDAEAEPGAAHVAAAALIHAVESLKDVRQVARQNPLPRVAHPQQEFVPRKRRAERDRAALGSELQRVVREVCEDLLHPQRVRVQRRDVLRHFDAQRRALRFCAQRKVARDAREKIWQRDFLREKIVLPRLHPRKHEQILDERRKPFRVTGQHLECLRLLLARHVGHIHELLEVALKNRERRAQLVRDVRDKFTAHLLEPLRVPDVAEHRERSRLTGSIAHRRDAHRKHHRRLARGHVQLRLAHL